MKINEKHVSEHYGHGGLLERILEGLKKTSPNLENIQTLDLGPVEEFHIGGRESTQYLSDQMEFSSEEIILDVGCGIGGTARFISLTYGCQVSGIDLTPEYIRVAKKLTEMTGQDEKISFEEGSALSLPYDSEQFDKAVSFHMAMNISEREKYYQEVFRVLKPGGLFGMFDILNKKDGALDFPVPWAETAETSHLKNLAEMEFLLEQSGFKVEKAEDWTPNALAFLEKLKPKPGTPPPPLGLHLVMGPTAKEKLTNIMGAIGEGLVGPHLILARKA